MPGDRSKTRETSSAPSAPGAQTGGPAALGDEGASWDLLDQLPTGLAIAEAPHGRLVVFNDAAGRILGHPAIPAEDRSGYTSYGAVHEDGRRFDVDDHPLARALAGEEVRHELVRYRRGDGRLIQLDVNAAPLFGAEGQVIAAVATFVDVTEQRLAQDATRRRLEQLVLERTRDLTLRTLELDEVNAELRALSESLEETVRLRTSELEASRARLAHQAQHDHLTGLPNRVLLEERLERAVASAERYGRRLAVLFLDLDGFKLVNDTWGHGVGDEVLREVARRLSSALRGSDTLARLGGDEFVGLVSDLRRPGDAREVAEGLLARLREPVEVAGASTTLGASVGVSLYPDDALDASTLQRHADAAMYRAKAVGKNLVAFYGDSPEAGGSSDD